MEKRTMGTLMSALRKSKGMTQQDIADKLGISNKTVSKWECDDGYPDISMLPAIAEIYGVSVDELLKGEITNKENQVRETSPDKSRKQLELLILTAFEKFKNTSAVALVFSLFSVAFGLLLKNIFENYIYTRTAALIAFCVSLLLSGIAITLEWFAGNALSFSISGEPAAKYADKMLTYLTRVRKFIAVVVGVSLVGIFLSGALWLSLYVKIPPIPLAAVGILIAVTAALSLFFLVGSKLQARVDDENIRTEASYNRKTAYGLVVGTLCVALLSGGVIGGIAAITNNHTFKFDDRSMYLDYATFLYEGKYPLLETDKEKFTVTVADDFDFDLWNGATDTPLSDPDGMVSIECGEFQVNISHYCYMIDTHIYTFDSRENMDKFIDDHCVDGGFLSRCPYELIHHPEQIYKHNDNKLTVKYHSGNFSDLLGIFLLFAVGICMIFDCVYIAVRHSSKKKHK